MYVANLLMLFVHHFIFKIEYTAVQMQLVRKTSSTRASNPAENSDSVDIYLYFRGYIRSSFNGLKVSTELYVQNQTANILTIDTGGNVLKTRIRFFDRMIDIFKPKVHGANISMENKSDMLPPSQLHTVNFSGSSNTPTQQLLLFLGQTLASLPYKYEEEPLYLIYLIDRHITIHGTNSVDLGNILISTKSKECEYNENHVNASYNGIYGLIILYELRKHLKRIYGLSASRIKKFDHGK